jgi:hypothetical protein
VACSEEPVGESGSRQRSDGARHAEDDVPSGARRSLLSPRGFGWRLGRAPVDQLATADEERDRILDDLRLRALRSCLGENPANQVFAPDGSLRRIEDGQDERRAVALEGAARGLLGAEEPYRAAPVHDGGPRSANEEPAGGHVSLGSECISVAGPSGIDGASRGGGYRGVRA